MNCIANTSLDITEMIQTLSLSVVLVTASMLAKACVPTKCMFLEIIVRSVPVPLGEKLTRVMGNVRNTKHFACIVPLKENLEKLLSVFSIMSTSHTAVAMVS